MTRRLADFRDGRSRLLTAIMLLAFLASLRGADVIATEADATTEQVAFWIDRVQSDDAGTRDHALRMLATLGVAVEAEVLRLAADEDWRTRACAVTLLPNLSTVRAREALDRALGDPAWAVRSAAIQAIPAIDDPLAIESIRDLLDDPVWAVRFAAVSALACSLDDATVTAELERIALEDPDPDVARHAASSLVTGQARPRLEILETYIESTPDDDLIDALGRIHAAPPSNATQAFFHRQLEHGGDEARIIAMSWFVRRGDVEVLDSAEHLAELVRVAAGSHESFELAELARQTLVLGGARLVPEVLDLMRGSTINNATHLFRTLAAMLGSDFPATLRDMLEQPDLAAFHGETLDHLTTLDRPDLAALAAAYLDRAPDSRHRRRAFAILEASGDARYRDRFIEALDDPDTDLRLLVIEGLIDILRGELSDPVDGVDDVDMVALVDPDARTTAILGKLVAAVLREPNSRARGRGVDQLARVSSKPTRDAVHQFALADDSPRVRRRAVISMPQLAIDPTATIRLLRRVLAEDGDDGVRAAATVALGTFDDPDAIQSLREIAFDDTESWMVRRAAYNRLAQLRPAELGSRLLQRLDAPLRSDERRTILDVLTRLDQNQQEICALLRGVIADDPALRAAAISAAARMPCDGIVATLLDAAARVDWDPTVRIAAIDALDRFEQPIIGDRLATILASRSDDLEVRIEIAHQLRKYAKPGTGSERALLDIVERRDLGDELPLLLEVIPTLCRAGNRATVRIAISIAIDQLENAGPDDDTTIWQRTVVRALQPLSQKPAAELFADILAQRPTASLTRIDPDVLLAMAEAARSAARPMLAAVLYEQTLAMSPGGAGASFQAAQHLAAIREDLHDFAGAGQAYRHAWRLARIEGFRAGKDAPLQGVERTRRLGAMANLMKAIRSARDGDLPTARSGIERTLDGAPHERHVTLSCAQYLIDLEMFPELALASARRAHRIAPFDAAAAVTLAESLLWNGDIDGAADTYRDLAASPTRDRDQRAALHYRLAMLELQRGAREQAWRDLTRAVRTSAGLLDDAVAEPLFEVLRSDVRWRELLGTEPR